MHENSEDSANPDESVDFGDSDNLGESADCADIA